MGKSKNSQANYQRLIRQTCVCGHARIAHSITQNVGCLKNMGRVIDQCPCKNFEGA